MPKYDLFFDPPVMNAAGILGFAPGPHLSFDKLRLGAFITNPVSLGPRGPAKGTRYLSYPGGLMLHTGYPNPGIKAVLRRYASRWQRAALPIMVHLLPQDAQETYQMAQRLEEVSGVSGLEIGIPPWAEMHLAVEIIRAAVGELPVIAHLPFDRATELAPHVVEAGAIAISLAPPRGLLTAMDGSKVHGRLYGPALYPQVLATVQILGESGLPVLGAGGLYAPHQAEIMLANGALGVQLDTVLWRGGWVSAVAI